VNSKLSLPFVLIKTLTFKEKLSDKSSVRIRAVRIYEGTGLLSKQNLFSRTHITLNRVQLTQNIKISLSLNPLIVRECMALEPARVVPVGLQQVEHAIPEQRAPFIPPLQAQLRRHRLSEPLIAHVRVRLPLARPVQNRALSHRQVPQRLREEQTTRAYRLHRVLNLADHVLRLAPVLVHVRQLVASRGHVLLQHGRISSQPLAVAEPAYGGRGFAAGVAVEPDRHARLEVDHLLVGVLELGRHVHLQIEHRADLGVGVGLVEEDEPALVERLVGGAQVGDVEVDLVEDVEAGLVVAADVGRVVDVVGEVLGVDGLVGAARGREVLVPVDEDGRAGLGELQLSEQAVLGGAAG